MTAKRLSLVDFAAEGSGNAVKCWLCNIPECQEVEDAILSGAVTKAAASRWLRDVCGYAEVSVHRVTNHMANHVRPAKSR